MRTLLPLCLIALLPGLGLSADEPKKKVEPIKVVTVDRKEPLIYEKDIEPILYKKCQFCHAGPVKEGRFDLGSYEALMRGGRNGKPVVPGKSAESLLVKSAGRTEKPYMPPLKSDQEPLTPEELALLKLWIDQGAKPPTSGVRERPKVVLTLLPATVQPVRAIAISADKSTVAAGRGNQLHIFEAGSGNYVRSLVDPNLMTADKKPVQAAHMSIVTALAFSPDGKILASGSYQEVVIWDAQTGAILHKLAGFADHVVTLAFSRDGKYLATGGGAPTEDGEIKIIDVATAKVVQDIKSGHSDTVYGVCFSPDGKMLATCGADKFVKVWEVPDGKLVKSFEGHTHHVLDVGWKADGKLLASAGADNVIKVWNFEKGEQERTINNAHTKQVTRLVFIGTTSQVATCSGDQNAGVFNVDNGGRIRNIGGSKDFLYALAVSPDGAIIATGGEEGIVRLYNGGNGTLLKELLPPGVKPAAEVKK
jgi:WD40 repeat protein